MFLTGATGFVGGEVIKRYLERSPDLHIVAMIRAVDEDRLEKRVDKLLKVQFGDQAESLRDRFWTALGPPLGQFFGFPTRTEVHVVKTETPAPKRVGLWILFFGF